MGGAMTTAPTYAYSAVVTNVHDGDTITADIDLGLGSTHSDVDLGFFLRVASRRLNLKVPLRLYGCNARELEQLGGPEAAANLAAMLPVGTVITVHSHKPLAPIDPDKYAPRWDASIRLADGSDLVASLIAEQWAAAWDGTGTRPVPPWPRTVT